jgi:rhamnose utilization protein RhaD (predicted bifunctional aldolase and dehydrogenase)/NAD(P)-dependent dehydrogenase (short-subunit alcohol dehydrogenase family)
MDLIKENMKDNQHHHPVDCCCSHVISNSETKLTDSQRRIKRLSRHLNRNATDSKTGITFTPYSEQEAAKYIEMYGEEWGEDLALRCYTSHLIGRDPNLVLHGGGNTSVKMVATNALNEKIEVTAVKGSGYGLDVIPPIGFPQVNTAHCRELLKLNELSDVAMVNELRTHMMDSSSPNPSVEALLHAMLPSKFVDHSHADAIVTIADLGEAGSARAVEETFASHGIKAGIVPYAMPGMNLALVCAKYYKDHQDVDCLVLLQHGLFTWGDTAKESYEMHIKCVRLAQEYIDSKCKNKIPQMLTPRSDINTPEYTTLPDQFKARLFNALRGSYKKKSGGATSWILRERKNDLVKLFTHSTQCAEWSQIGTITPDHVIRTKGFPMLLTGAASFLSFSGSKEEAYEALGEFCAKALDDYESKYHEYFLRNNDGSKIELDPLPRVVLIDGIGLVTVGKSLKEVNISADIYEHTVPVILNCMALGGYRPVSELHLFECEYWELEQRKLKLGAKVAGPLDGQVLYVTGGASGIGLATAEAFGKAGAALFLADVRQDRIDEQINRLSKMGLTVSGSVVDVTDREQVELSVRKAIFAFGGVDCLVSNAGVVVQAAPGMASCPPEELMKSLKINFLGHQWVTSAVVRAMQAQATGGCLLFNVSKAPLNPGPQLGPYAIAKAATLALMRQYAVEYGQYGIRSNAVNADRIKTNLFDMSLVEERAKSRGLTASEYFASNLLKTEVLAYDVAGAFLNLALSKKTTGGIYTVDGGNIAASPR